MSERSDLIHRLIENVDTRASYIKAKLGILVPSQIRSLRLQSEMQRQSDLASAARLHQSRISMFETPGAANMTIETLSRLAAAFKVGLRIEFVSFHDMLKWENGFSQDAFHVQPIDKDYEFQNPGAREPKQELGAGDFEDINHRLAEASEPFPVECATSGNREDGSFNVLQA